MGLIQPAGPSWAYCSHNYPAATPDPTTLGVACTVGVNNSDGSAVTLLSALAHDVEFLTLRLSNQTHTNHLNNNVLMDLLVDPAGGTSWSVLIEDLIAGGLPLMASVANNMLIPCGYDFPIWIPAGASLGVRARTAHASTAQVINVLAIASGGNRNPASWWCGQRVSTINASPSTSNGGTHTPGNGTFSSWADFGSPLGAACGALQWGIGGEDDSAWAQLSQPMHFQFEFGVAGERIGAPVFRSHSSNEQGMWVSPGPIFRQLASGTQLQVRAIGSHAAGALGVTAYAVH